MSQRLNLNDNVNSTFPFTVGGVDFDLKYPTLEELEPVNQINADRSIALNAGDNDKVAELDKKLEEVFYSFIVPVDGSSDIQTVLKQQPFPVIKAFGKMIREQLAVD